ncbi:hypothetical protein J3F84DRAFT_149214 [Trichoderma pleuroticola]
MPRVFIHFLTAEERRKAKKIGGLRSSKGGDPFGLPRFLGPDNGIQPRPMTRTKLSDMLAGQKTHGPHAGRFLCRSSSLPAQLGHEKSEGEGHSRSYSRSPGKTRPSGDKNPLWMQRLGAPEAVGHSRRVM